MYTTAVLQRKSIQTFLLPPPPPPPLCFSSPLSVSRMSRTVRQASRPFVVLKRNLGGGQRVTLGKVTDERAVEEGGEEVTLKSRGGIGKIDHRLRKKKKKKPFKDPLPARESHRVTSHDQETHEKPRDREKFRQTTATHPADQKCNIMYLRVNPLMKTYKGAS